MNLTPEQFSSLAEETAFRNDVESIVLQMYPTWLRWKSEKPDMPFPVWKEAMDATHGKGL